MKYLKYLLLDNDCPHWICRRTRTYTNSPPPLHLYRSRLLLYGITGVNHIILVQILGLFQPQGITVSFVMVEGQ